jgi:O-antigen/teichoic acid export membrane protein
VAIVVAQLVASAALGAAGYAAFRRFPSAPAEPLADDSPEIRAFVLQSSVATGVVSLRGTLTPLLLGTVANVAQVGAFRVALTPQQGLAVLSAPARIILLTEQTRDWERGEHARVIAGVRRYSAGAAAVMAVVLVPLFVWMPDLLRLLGDDYVRATAAARIILVAAVLQFVYGWTKSFPVTIGRPNLRIVTHGLETAVLVPLVLLLGARWGATGAAVATLVSTVVFCAHWTVLYARVRRAPHPGGPAPRPREAVAR